MSSGCEADTVCSPRKTRAVPASRGQIGADRARPDCGGREFREELMGASQRVVSVAATALVIGLLVVGARAADYKPVTQDMLVDPPAADWLQISRTYDEQRYSPLDQINKSNVAKLQMAFSRGLPPGTLES